MNGTWNSKTGYPSHPVVAFPIANNAPLTATIASGNATVLVHYFGGPARLPRCRVTFTCANLEIPVSSLPKAILEYPIIVIYSASWATLVALVVVIVWAHKRRTRPFASWISRAPGFRLAGDWGDAERALEALPAKKPDVVLMDINLPGMSGVDAVKRLKPLLPDTQFVMLTVYEDADHIYNALAAGATGICSNKRPGRSFSARSRTSITAARR